MSTIDRNIAYFPLTMVCEKMPEHIDINIASGYKIVQYDPKYKAAWIQLHIDLKDFKDFEYGEKIFESTFESEPELLKTNMFIMIDEDHDFAGTCTLWYGNHFGVRQMRLHYVAVSEKHQQRGIAKALCLKCMQLFKDGNYDGQLYLTTQTNSYIATRMYRQLGFVPYLKALATTKQDREQFEHETILAWENVEKYLKKMD